MSRRVALLVATYRYQDTGLRQLTAPAHDAEELAEVLRHPEIAGFDVRILLNEPHHVVGKAIGEFYRNRRRDDLTLLYFTGHGLKDDEGRLYLAMTNTTRDDLLFTALSAQQIDYALDSCASRQKVLVLDCCYSGAFPAGSVFKADSSVHTLERFKGKGRVVLTASDATQYSFEGNRITGKATQSVFTRLLIEGLTTGDADLDSDGDISLDELYSYVYDRVVDEMPQQRPKKQENIEGRIIIARNINWRLPPDISNALESLVVQDRLSAVENLAHLHRVGNDFVRAEVIMQICHLIYDDDELVSVAAKQLMTTINPGQARQEFADQEKAQAVTSLTLPALVDNTTIAGSQPDLQSGADLDLQIGATTKHVLQSTGSDAGERPHASRENEAHHATVTQNGRHLQLSNRWDLTHLTRRQMTLAVVVLSIISLVIAIFVTIIPGGSTGPSITTPKPSDASTMPTATSSPGFAETPTKPAIRTVNITVRGGKASGETGRIAVSLGTSLVVSVSSDVADEIHVHGYDRKVKVPAGATASVTFTANIAGVFLVELEESKLTLFQLQVS